MLRQDSSSQLIDHLFRHESGKMVSILCHILGIQNLELVEDVVQESFLKAVQHWRFGRIPENPSAWLMEVAKNKAIDSIRKNKLFDRYAQEFSKQNVIKTNNVEQFFHDNEISDSQLRMIFACCHPALNEEDQVALTLKTVSGFSLAEIAKALSSNEVTIKKRLARARKFIRDNHIQLEIPASKEISKRLDTVHTVLYLLFNEGYNSQKADELIRKDVCAEAMRLVLLLCEHKLTHCPASYALLALMCFHVSRFDSRIENDHIIILQNQDRSKWNKELISKGRYFLNKSAIGNQLSVYHIEAAIAAEHCNAISFKETNWHRILALYETLIEHSPGPMAKLNRSVVLSQIGNTDLAIQDILKIPQIENLLKSQYIYGAVLGDLYQRSGDIKNSMKYLHLAMQLSKSQAEQGLISEKLKHIERVHSLSSTNK